MFGRRSDGKQIKGIDGLTRMMPQLMRTRNDATNFYKMRVPAEKLDEFIASKAKEGINYTYRDIILTILVRMFKVLPRLNRFVSNGRFYQRNNIDVSLTVHKSLRTGDQETIVKIRFTGYETIAEVKQKFENEVAQALDASHKVDGLINLFAAVPLWVLKAFGGIIRLFDHWGMWRDNFLRANSPFHTSIFISDLKSVKMEYVYHHLYNFGNCGFFLALGKEHTEVGFDGDGKVVPQKIIDCGISQDERFTDGLYFRKMVKQAYRIVDNLAVLERNLEESEIYHEKTWAQIKAERKAKKKAKRAKKKETKILKKAGKAA